MRPTDENQDGSTRPNLLSGGRRRFADDDNILARLERDSARQALGNRNRAAWHAVAAGLVLLAVAWIAHENVRAPHVAPAARVPVDLAPATAAVIAAATASGPAPVTNIQPEPVPVHAAAARASAATGLPPLVLLDGARPAPPQPAAPRVRAAEPAAPPVATRSHAPLRPAVAAAVRAAPRVAAAARPRKLAVDTTDPATLADTDVALLSAIIIQDSSHAEERAQLESTAACTRSADKRCVGR